MAFSDVVNYTDPRVIKDSVIDPSVVAKLYDEANSNEELNQFTGSDENPLKVDGVYIPIVKVGNCVLESANIKELQIIYTEFVPTLKLIVTDFDERLQSFELPQRGSVITVILIPQVDGVYRKISLDFSIVNDIPISGQVTYFGEFVFWPFEINMSTQLSFSGYETPHDNYVEEDEGDDIKLEPTTNMTTWEFLYTVATWTGMGFQCTDETYNIEDRRPRFIQNETFKQAIKKYMKFAGKNEDNIFDCWVDLWGYITLVNVKYVMDAEVDVDDLGIYSINGWPQTNNYGPEPQPVWVNRVLSINQELGEPSNMEIDTYHEEYNQYNIKSEGNLKTYFSITPDGVGDGNNSIKTDQIQITENTIDGAIDPGANEYSTVEFQGMEMDDENPVLMQQNLTKTYFNKLKERKLRVTLKMPNYGLQRGTLVGILLTEYRSTHKAKILHTLKSWGNFDNENDDGSDDITFKNAGNNDLTVDERNMVGNEGIGIPNVFLSGIYYIDGMEFDYDGESQIIVQKLFLIKKDAQFSYNDKFFPLMTSEEDFVDIHYHPENEEEENNA